jgi:hypothetical protein
MYLAILTVKDIARVVKLAPAQVELILEVGK